MKLFKAFSISSDPNTYGQFELAIRLPDNWDDLAKGKGCLRDEWEQSTLEFIMECIQKGINE